MKFKLAAANVGPAFAMPVPIYLELNNGKVIRLGTMPLFGDKSVEQEVPLKGLKDKPRRAMIAYYDDLLGNIENK